MDGLKCFSDRTLRYGRNLNLLSFLTLGVVWFNVSLANANLFGISPEGETIWMAILIMFGYHFLSFLILVYIDFPKWWGSNIIDKIPCWTVIFRLRWTSKEMNDHYGKISVTTERHQYIWSYKDPDVDTSNLIGKISQSDFHTLRRTLYHTIFFDFGIPIILSVLSVNEVISNLQSI